MTGIKVLEMCRDINKARGKRGMSFWSLLIFVLIKTDISKNNYEIIGTE